MNIKKVFVIFTAIIIFAAGSTVITCYPLKAEEAALMAKLTEITDNQKKIMEDIAAIKAELSVIKIRITQNQ